MKINKDAFFDAVKQPLFKNRFRQEQVDGLNALLDATLIEAEWPLEWVAYALATAYHETAFTMQPINEYGNDSYFFRMYDKDGDRPHVAKDLGNTEAGDGVKFHGRGYVQLTGRANYEKMGEIFDLPLTDYPEMVLEEDVAAAILVYGMENGSFTGKSLEDYFNDAQNDPINARRIINRLDKAEEIAEHYNLFLLALNKSVTLDKIPEEIDKNVNLLKRIERIEQILRDMGAAANGL